MASILFPTKFYLLLPWSRLATLILMYVVLALRGIRTTLCKTQRCHKEFLLKFEQLKYIHAIKDRFRGAKQMIGCLVIGLLPVYKSVDFRKKGDYSLHTLQEV